MREYQGRICEGLGVKFPGPTRRQPVDFFTRQTAEFDLKLSWQLLPSAIL
jgi:hypothetical protein